MYSSVSYTGKWKINIVSLAYLLSFFVNDIKQSTHIGQHNLTTPVP